MRRLVGGVKDGEPSREVLTVTGRTKTIAGATCVVIEDRLYLGTALEQSVERPVVRNSLVSVTHA
jgi:hypothetical protein